MKLFLIAVAAFYLVVCQAQARDPWADNFENSNRLRTPTGVSQTSFLKDRLHRLRKINRGKPGTDKTRAINHLRIEIGKTIIQKVKELAQGVVTLLEMFKILTDKIGWTILSQFVESLIDALNQFTVTVDTSEESLPNEIAVSPESDTPQPTPLSIPMSEPSTTSTSKPSRSAPFRSYSHRCHQNDMRPGCRRGRFVSGHRG